MWRQYPTCFIHTSPIGQILTSGLGFKQHDSMGPQPGLHSPSLGRELPLTLHGSPILLPGSTSNPRETQPKLNDHKHQTSATKIPFVRETSCALGTGEKNPSFEAPSFGKNLNGSKAFCSESEEKLMGLKMCLCILALTQPVLQKHLLFFTKSTSSSVATPALHQFHGRYRSSSVESDCHSVGRNSTREILTQS